MPSWNELLQEFNSRTVPKEKLDWFNNEFKSNLTMIGKRRGDRNVLFYASSFLQKPTTQANLLQITSEEINGFMSMIHGLDCSKGLVLVMHTPGGLINAVESIVDYLWSKFLAIEIIIPTYAMSAGTMISLSCDLIIMGRHSQLGPIDPQMPFMGGYVSARAIVDQFDQAKSEIVTNTDLSHAWYPILQSMGPSLVKEADNALKYGERLVAERLEQHMFNGDPENRKKATDTAAWFNNASVHKDHGRRIGRDEARAQNVKIEDLETDQELQEAVLTAYHLVTIMFEQTPAGKLLSNNLGRSWIKNV